MPYTRHGYVDTHWNEDLSMAWVEKRGDGFRVRYRLDDTTIHTEYGYTSQHEADDRAADVESDQRRHQFADPRLARTSIDDWIRAWATPTASPISPR